MKFIEVGSILFVIVGSRQSSVHVVGDPSFRVVVGSRRAILERSTGRRFTSFEIGAVNGPWVHVVQDQCCHGVCRGFTSLKIGAVTGSIVGSRLSIFAYSYIKKVFVFIVIEIRDSFHGLLPRVDPRIAG